MTTVRLYANLRKLADTRELPVCGATLGEALNDLIRQRPALRNALFQGEELRPHVIVILNGQNLVSLDTAVTEQDVIAVFPPIGGGSSAAQTLRPD